MEIGNNDYLMFAGSERSSYCPCMAAMAGNLYCASKERCQSSAEVIYPLPNIESVAEPLSLEMIVNP